MIPGVLVVAGAPPFTAPALPDGATLVIFSAPEIDQAEVDMLLQGIGDTAEAATLGTAPTETVKLVEGGRVLATLAREQLVETRLPQVVRSTALPEPGTQLGDPAAWVAQRGGRVKHISVP